MTDLGKAPCFGADDCNHDPEQAARVIKRRALALGADMVGIGSIDRWQGAPIQMDPKQIMPECRSIIAMGFRVMRGSLRGVEEGTYFSNYSAMGYGGITYLYMPMTVIDLSRFIEDRGYEAIPMGHQSDWRAIDNEGQLKPQFSRPVAAGRAAPDIMVQLRIAGFLCGLGEIGWSKMLLTPEFGPRQRVGIILTDLPLAPDPIYDGPTLCNRCMACVQACPGGCIPKDDAVNAELAGHQVSWANVNMQGCDMTFRGAQRPADGEPAGPAYETWWDGQKLRPGDWSPFYEKPRNLYNTGQAVCGARGCTRACMMSMERRGVLKNRFHEPFRRREPWSVDWSAPDPNATTAAADGSQTD